MTTNLLPNGLTHSSLSYDQSAEMAELIKWCNSLSPREIEDRMFKRVQKIGAQVVAVFGDTTKYDQATIMSDSFSAGPTSNRLFRAWFTALFIEGKGPLIFTSSPGIGSRMGLDRNERRVVASGDVWPAAKAIIKAARRAVNFDRVNIIGPSQGAMLAMGAVDYLDEIDVEVGSVAAIEPVNSEARSLPRLISDFMADKDLKRAQETGGINAQKEFLNFEDMAMFFAGVFKPENLALLKAMKRDGFLDSSRRVLEIAEKFTVARGDHSAMARTEFIVPQLEQLAREYPKAIISNYRIESSDGLPVGHTLADNLPLYAKIVQLSLPR